MREVQQADNFLDAVAKARSQFQGVTLFAGDGRGGFQKTSSTPATVNSLNSIAAGDFNGDRIDDIAIGRSDGSVEIWLSDVNGHLSSPTNYPMVTAPAGLLEAIS
jgi:hypothetical protein